MMSEEKPEKSILVKVTQLPPSKAFRKWIQQHIPRGVKILYTLK